MTQRDSRFSRRTLLGGTAATAGAALVGQANASAAPSPRVAAPAVLRQEPVTVRIAISGTREGAAAVETLFEPFQEQHPDIRVEALWVQASDWDAFFAKILTMIAGGQAPDVVYVATEGTQLFAGKGLAQPLDEYVNRDAEQLQEFFADVAPSLIEAMMYEGSLYELPDGFNATNIVYNQKRFQDRGVPLPHAEWTFDDFVSAMPELITQDGDRTTEYGYFWTNRMWGGAVPWIFINDSNVLTEERAPGGEWLWEAFYPDDPAAQGRGGGWRWLNSQANDPRNVEALQFLMDLTYEMKAAPTPVEAEGSNSQLITTFAAEKLASWAGGGFAVRGIAEAGMGPDEYGVTYFPRWKSQRHQFGTAGLVMMKDAPNKDAAWEVLKYRVTKEAMRSNFEATSSVRARRSLNPELYGDTYGMQEEDYRVFYDTLDKHPDTAPIPQPPQANEMTAIFTKYIGLAMSQDMTAQDALDTMHDELSELLAQPL